MNIDQDTLRPLIEQAVEAAKAELVTVVEGFMIEILENQEPKEAEQDLRQGVLRVGAEVVGQTLEDLDPVIREVVRRRAHRDGQGGWCEGSIEGKGCKPITLETSLGEVRVNRWTGTCVSCGRWIGSVEELLDTVGHLSAGAANIVSLSGVLSAYEPAEQLVAELTGLEIDDNIIQRTVGALSGRAEAVLEGSLLASPHLLPPPEVPVYVMIDGGRIRFRPPQGWREPCTALVLWQEPDGRWVKYGLSDPTDKAVVQRVLDRWMQRLAEQPTREVVIVADGALWIWEWAKKYPWAIQILDYYHLKEHLWKAARGLYGQDEPRAGIWVQQIMQRLWRGWVPSTIDQLQQLQNGLHMTASQREAVGTLLTYLRNHRGLIAYGRHRNAGRRIGSGAIESFCNQLFSMRMKGAGMFWSEAGAKALMSLRTLYLTDHWQLLWHRRPVPGPIIPDRNAA